MPRHSRQLADSAVYHVMARGVNRDAIFLDNEDYERYLYALQLTKEASHCAVLAYCLMPNHVHLVLQTSDEPVGDVMKRLGVRYAGCGSTASTDVWVTCSRIASGAVRWKPTSTCSRWFATYGTTLCRRVLSPARTTTDGAADDGSDGSRAWSTAQHSSA